MENIETLSSLEGRALLKEIFMELRYERQRSGLSTLLLCWRICTKEKELNKYVNKNISLLYPLGILKGTGLWMEEIVNRFYYSTVNSFVYFGAAVLLVLIGLRRFSDGVNPSIVIGGIIFEASLLICMFIVMLFTPNEELDPAQDKEKDNEMMEELVTEIGEIGRDFAAVVVQMEQLSGSMDKTLDKQTEMITLMHEIISNSAQAIAPNPEMLEAMKATNVELNNFKSSLNQLNESADAIKKKEIEQAVRKEIEKILVQKIS